MTVPLKKINLINQMLLITAASPVKEEPINNVAPVEDVFFDLDIDAKQLAEQICNMGFPRPRVARIVKLMGADDKKVNCKLNK